MPIVPPEDYQLVVRKLRSGGVAAIPTDTVYGVAAVATDHAAVRALAHLKGRAEEQPIAVLIDSVAVVGEYLEDPAALDRVAGLWPGPLTAVVRAKRGMLSPSVVTEAGTVGVRKPDDSLARLVIRECGGMLAVTSANRHGEPPATSAEEVTAIFGAGLLVLDGGPRPGGAPSTVVDLSVDPPRVLREGPVSAADLGLAG